MMKPSKEQIDHWKRLGNRLGYPICCILSFTALKHIQDP